jgi:hypothetical protein
MFSEAYGYEPGRPGLLSPIGLALLFAVFAAMYFQSLTGLSLTADDDHAISRTDPSLWVQQGRWGTYLVERFILPLPVITFLPYALFGMSLCVSFALLATSLGVSTLSSTVLVAFALFVGVPQWLFIMEFSANLVPVGIGFLCASGSAFTFDKAYTQELSPWKRLALIATSVGFLCLATSVYKSLFVAGLLMSSAIIVVRFSRAEMNLVRILWLHAVLGLAGVIAYALYALIGEAFHMLLQLERVTFYADTLIQPLEAIRNIHTSWAAAVAAYKSVVWGHLGFYGTSVSIFGLATVAASIILIVAAFRRDAVRGVAVALWVAAAWLAVVVFHFAAAGGFVPYRVMLQLPALVAVLAIVILSIRAEGVRIAALLLFAGAVFQESVVINRAAASHELVAVRDAYIAGDLFRRIASVGRKGEDGLYKIQTLGVSPGQPAYPMPMTSYVALSWFAHETHYSYRAVQYMRMLGYPVSDAAVGAAAYSQQWKTMPSWPADGSVAAFGDVTLIKLNEVPGLE